MLDKKVNLLIIGTQKAGTTSLFNYLKQHPDLYFSEIKEVTYFVNDEHYKKGEAYYHSAFYKYKGQKVVAGAYVHMLPCKKAAERVKAYNPEMKFIVMLRDPVKRAYSAFHYALDNGWETETKNFKEAFELEKERLCSPTINYDLTYFYNGLYHQHLTEWFNYFGKDRFLLLRDTDLKNNPAETLTSIFRFLGIAEAVFVDTSKKFNETGKLRSKTLQKLILTRNSGLKKIGGRLLSSETKIFIRSKIFPLLTKLNSGKKGKNYKQNFRQEAENFDFIKDYYLEDLHNLEKEFNIRLVQNDVIHEG